MTATTAPTARQVSRERRGARATLRKGMRTSEPPGIRKPDANQARPPERAARCPVLMASMGATRVPAHTGIIVAANGMAKPIAAANPNTPSCSGVRQAGSGRKSARYAPSACAIAKPIATPNTTPKSATWALKSSGRSAISGVGTPSAMPMPISRRWASTTLPARLNAASAAPPNTAAAKTALNWRSPSTSSISSRIDGSSIRRDTAPPISANRSSSARATASASDAGDSLITRSFTRPSAPAIRWAVSMDANTAAKFACPSSPPSGVMTKKYSGASACPTYETRAPPDSDASPSAGRS